MAAYVLVDIEVKDPAGFGEYLQLVGPILDKYGGKVLAAGPPAATLEGSWRPAGMTVLEFPSVEHARQWHAAPEYEGPKQIRQKTATSQMILVDGWSGPPAP